MQVTDPTPAPIENPEVPTPEVEEREQSFEDFERELEGKGPAPAHAPAAGDPPAEPPPVPEEKPAKPERPFKRILAANAQTNAELERLRAENARLAALAQGVAPPAPPAPTQVPADAQVDQYGPKVKPNARDFDKDGVFDSEAYLDARDAWTRAEALREVDRREADRTKASQVEAEEVEIRQAAQTWHSQAQELAKEDPEIGEAIAFMRRDDVASFIPEKVQIQLLRVNPLVSVAIASRQDLLDVMQLRHGATEDDAMRLIGRIEGVLEMATSRANAAPAPGAVEAPEPPRTPSGQFAPAPARVPAPKPAPRGPVDLGGGGSASVNPIDMDFATYEKHMDAKRRGR